MEAQASNQKQKWPDLIPRYMLLQLPPRAEAVLACNYVPRVVKGWVGHVDERVNRVPSSKCLRVPSL